MAVIACIVLLLGLLSGCERGGSERTGGRDTADTSNETRSAGDRNSLTSSSRGQSRGQEMAPEEIAEYLSTRVVKITTDISTGSGFFVDDSGTIVTNYHVIDGASQIEVDMPDGARYDVKTIVDFSNTQDVAVLKIDVTGNDYLTAATEYKQGESVYVYGSPRSLDASFTSGTLSNTDRKRGGIDCIQIDASIAPGNSGGPVVNSRGEVLGIAKSSLVDSQNTNFAIKVSVLDELSMDKNYSVNRFVEWYNTETGRSYMGTEDGRTFYNSFINTFTQITGEKCLASMDEDGTYKEGYSIMYLFYAYEYDVDSYDKYCDYLREIGFEYYGATREMGMEGVIYYNEMQGYLIHLLIDTTSNLLVVSCPGTASLWGGLA